MKMKPFARRFLCICFLILFGTSHADQNDPRLDELFNQLKFSPDFRYARHYSEEIWRLWYLHGDKEIQAKFDTAVDAMYQRNFDTALASINEVIKQAPDFAEAWNTRAIIYFLQEDLQASLDDIAEVLKREPRHFGALVGAGQCYFKLEKLEPALKAYEKALEVNPWLYDARENIDTIRQLLDKQT